MINIVITTCGEKQVLDLIDVIYQKMNKKQYKLWVLRDATSDDKNNIYPKIEEKAKNSEIKVAEFPLDGDFSEFRNSIHRHIAEGDWIFQIDADEMINPDLLVYLPKVIESNPDVELYYLPRNNYVNGITEEYARSRNWRIDDYGRINYPDHQGRIYKFKDGVRWSGVVHESVKGTKKHGMLSEPWAHLEHVKDFEKQKKQNELYDRIS